MLVAVRIVVVNAAIGNLRSVANAFEAIGRPVEIADRPESLAGADGIVLPGVGAFEDAMRNLRELDFVPALEHTVRRQGTPFIGLCLGMQLLASTSTEHGLSVGLGWIEGSVERIEANGALLRVPHIGWNEVRFVEHSRLFAGLGEAQTFYFVHSYVFRPRAAAVVTGVCEYGGEFAAAIEDGNIFGTQFHPEKSQQAGLGTLRNFVDACSKRD